MANRDILVLNTTASRAETQQTSDTVLVKGGGKILSIENSSNVDVLTINSSGSTTQITGDVVSTGNLTGAVTGSFGKVEGVQFIGSAAQLTNTDLPGTLSSSAQIASVVTGSFRQGFEFTREISGSKGSTGSFDRIIATTFFGNANELNNTAITDTISGSAQIATSISGSFTSGFEFSAGDVSGSVSSTGSFGRLETTTITGDASQLTNYIKEGTVSSSAQIATSISGSFNKGFNYTGRIGSTLDAWSSGNNINVGSLGGTSAGSSKHSALRFGGRYAPSNAFCTLTEEWNGTNWSEVGDMNDNRHEAMGGGSTESALSTGGCNGSGIASPALTEYWNGTNWAECADLITPRKNGASAGTTADIIVVGGAAPSATTHVELYNLSGNAWSETTESPTALNNLDAVGTQNSTFIANDAPNSSLEWNGSAWFTAAGSIIDRSYFGLAGTVNDAVQVGATSNTPTLRTCTEKWNGYSWSVGVDAIYSQGAQKLIQGTGRSAVQFGSSQNDGTGCTQTQMYEASDDLAEITTLTAQTLFGDGSELENTKVDNMVSSSAQLASRISGSFNKGFEFDGKIEKVPDGWSAGPNMIFARTQQASAANSRDAVIVFGGRYGNTPAGSFNNGAPNCVEEYNGTNWSEITDLPSGRYQIWGAGHAESALSGDASGNSGTNGVEYYNGSNWAEAANLITAVNKAAGTGDGGGADAAVVVGGVPGYKCFQQYDLSGDAWTELADPIFNVASVGATGPSDAVIIPGWTHPGPPTAASQCWPGSTWESFVSHTTNRAGQTGIFGTQNDAIVMGGSNNVGNNRCCTEHWNGTSWQECNAAPTGIAGQTALQGNSGNAGLAAGTSYGVTSPTPSCGHHTWNGTQLWNGGYVNSGSFGRVDGIEFVGSGKNVVNFPVPTGMLSGSSGIASNISASFAGGFEFSSGDISGSINSTGSFNNLKATKFFGDGKHLTNTALRGTVSGSSQIASNISGSFSGKFDYRWSIRASKGAFTVGGALISDRCNAGGFGNKNAAMVAGGRGSAATAAPNNWPGGLYNNPMGTIKNAELYNGISWSEVTAMIYGRDKLMGAGTSTDGILAGGGTYSNGVVACTETWDGSSWTEKSDMNYCTKNSGAAGESSNSAIVFGGEYATPASHYVGCAESWDGSSWSEIDNLNYGRTGGAGFGNAAAAIYGAGTPNPGGHAPGNSFDVEEWDGTVWTKIAETLTNNFNSYHNGHGAGAGTVNDGHIFGGYYFNPGAPTTRRDALSQHWDGTSWTYGGRLVVGRSDIAGDGTSGGDAFAAGGGSPSLGYCNTYTEEYTQTYTTASAGHICAVKLKGELNELSNVTFPDGRISSSAQFNEEISGSFQKGFEYTGDIRAAKGAWSIGGYMVVGRRCLSGAGIQNAALATGGQTANYGNAYLKCSEEYDGTSWTEGNDMITYGRERAQVGTQNASLLFGGWNTCDDTEEYNGTNYATAANMAIGRYAMIGFGTQNAAIGAGGTVSDSNGGSASTEQYDGASWTNQVSMITPRFIGGAGTINSAIVGFGRNSPTRAMNCTELWNGTAWSETVEAIVTGEQGVSYGTQNTFAITAGCGESPYPVLTTTQFFDGISYSTDGNLITAGYNRCGANKAGQDAGLVFGGYSSRTICETEEYNAYYTTGSFGRVETPDVQLGGDSQLVVSASLQIPVYATSVGIVSSSAGQMFFTTGSNQLNFTIDVNGWSAGGNLINARAYAGGAGTQNAAIAVGGEPASADETTELYNGSAWSEDADIDVPRTQHEVVGQQNSALAFGGQQVASPYATYDKTEAFDGSSWTEVNTLNKTRRLHYGLGTQNAALAASGRTVTPASAIIANTEEWNGDVWTAAADINVAKGFGAAGGTQNAGIIFGGSTAHSTNTTVGQTETYDGTAWTERNDMIHARQAVGGSGTQNAAIAFGGTTDASNPNTTCTEEWNGTSWSAVNVLPTAIRNISGAGSQASAIAFGGYESEYAPETQEYSVCGLKTVSIDGV